MMRDGHSASYRFVQVHSKGCEIPFASEGTGPYRSPPPWFPGNPDSSEWIVP